jgi:Bifunctional DNA primase/polymerase, N-terminal
LHLDFYPLLTDKSSSHYAIYTEGDMTGHATMRDKAVELAQQGFRVFPLAAGRKDPPITPDGFDKPPKKQYHQHIPSKDPQVVAKMWTGPGGQPLAYNIGINTNELLAVDTDNKDGKNGEAELAGLAAKYGICLTEPTVEVLTPTGGWHRYYQLPEGVSVQSTQGDRGGLAPGVDTRS